MIPDVLEFGRNGFGDELLRGAALTLVIAFSSFLIGLILGQLGAMAKLFGGPVPRFIAIIYTTVIRAVPELVLILLLFFAGTRGISALGVALGYGPIDINGTLAAILVLGFVQGAYSTEVIRGAIQAIPVGQLEAARAYGMSGSLIFRRIIVPAMLPNAIPGLANLWLVVIKDTALITVTGASSELAQVTKNAAGFTKRYFLFYFTSGCIYLTMTLASNYLLGRLERRVRRGQPKLT
ncbi:MAG TPA: ABC transporter permease subunit [Aestuariivirga sp.]|jgi:polar amino acid transport system permease protein|nr:ABC transporter permease subunit [Aestuariivirga sp.]